MVSDKDRALSRPDYWDGKYARGDGHEWYRTFEDLEPFFQTTLFESDRVSPEADPLILHLGSGDSAVPVRFASRGYARQVCVDFSSTVVDMMSEEHAKIRGIEWKHADVRNMGMLKDESVDLALDKGTLDVMVYGSCWNPPDEVKNNTRSYMQELHRVLMDDGLFLCITFRQPRFIKPLLDPDGSLWHVDMQEISTGEGTFPYYGYVVRKRTILDGDTDPEVEINDSQAPSHRSHDDSNDEGEENSLKPEDDSNSWEEDPDSLRALFDY